MPTSTNVTTTVAPQQRYELGLCQSGSASACKILGPFDCREDASLALSILGQERTNRRPRWYFGYEGEITRSPECKVQLPCEHLLHCIALIKNLRLDPELQG